MLLIYGDFNVAITVTGTGAAILTDATHISNGRSGDGVSFRWISGAQTTASFVQINLTITSPLEASAAVGGVGLVNVQGLPLGTLVQVGASAQQRLVQGPRLGEPCAWTIPFLTGNSQTVKIFNDVNGAATIPASQIFAIGEIVAGRIMSLPSLVNYGAPTRTPFDPTAAAQTAGGSDWQTYRKLRWQQRHPLGIFTRADVQGGAAKSSLLSGAASSGKIDLQNLISLLSTSQRLAVCDMPNITPKGGTLTNGIRFDQNDMQQNWMLARANNLDSLAQNASPYYTWSPTWAESR